MVAVGSVSARKNTTYPEKYFKTIITSLNFLIFYSFECLKNIVNNITIQEINQSSFSYSNWFNSTFYLTFHCLLHLLFLSLSHNLVNFKSTRSFIFIETINITVWNYFIVTKTNKILTNIDLNWGWDIRHCWSQILLGSNLTNLTSLIELEGRAEVLRSADWCTFHEESRNVGTDCKDEFDNPLTLWFQSCLILSCLNLFWPSRISYYCLRPKAKYLGITQVVVVVLGFFI